MGAEGVREPHGERHCKRGAGQALQPPLDAPAIHVAVGVGGQEDDRRFAQGRANFAAGHVRQNDVEQHDVGREALDDGQRELLLLLGGGFDPGVTNVFCAYAQKHLLDDTVKAYTDALRLTMNRYEGGAAVSVSNR